MANDLNDRVDHLPNFKLLLFFLSSFFVRVDQNVGVVSVDDNNMVQQNSSHRGYAPSPRTSYSYYDDFIFDIQMHPQRGS